MGSTGTIRVSARTRVRAELTKIARLLGVDEARIDYLETLDVEELRQLRESITDELFDNDRDVLERLASASRLLPMGLVASLGQSVMGPVVSARITALSDPARAAAVAERLPTPFLAEVCAALDPRRSAAVIGRMPDQITVAVAQELFRRRDFVSMGQMVGLVTRPALEAILPHLDDKSLQLILATAEDPERAKEIRQIRAAAT